MSPVAPSAHLALTYTSRDSGQQALLRPVTPSCHLEADARQLRHPPTPTPADTHAFAGQAERVRV